MLAGILLLSKFSMALSSQNQHLAAARAKAKIVLADKQATLASETATDDFWNRLQVANSHIEELEQQLAQRDADCIRLQSELDKSNQKLDKHQEGSALWKAKHEKTYYELRMQHQTTQQGQVKLAWL
jgi:predicted  nucleic acid-binding Zn-ribbon protein